MQPLDSDLEYGITPRPARPGSRLNLLLVFPIIGVLIVLFFITAALFQINISAIVDSLIGVVLFLFFLFIVGIFWALAPRSNNS
jgi:hypothetical protein